MDYLITTDNLTKEYHGHKAVNNVCMHVKQGDIYGFIGRNGAGKTTTLKMIAGLAEPTEGSFSIFNYTGKNVKKVLSRVGTLIEAPGMYPNMNAYDNLKLKALCAGISKKGYIEDIIELIGLRDAGKKKLKNYSLGMKQRLGIGLALVGDPDILLLDEPINGLDPRGIVEVRDTLLKLNKERNITIVISSHILEELSKIATTYGIIENGVLLKEISKEQLLENCKEHIEICLDSPQSACSVLDRIGISDYKIIDKNTIHIFNALEKVSEINFALAENRVMVNSIKVENEALEDYFLEVTGGKKND